MICRLYSVKSTFFIHSLVSFTCDNNLAIAWPAPSYGEAMIRNICLVLREVKSLSLSRNVCPCVPKRTP
jgi:hypothetical protein